MISLEIADKKNFQRVVDYSFEEFSKAMAKSQKISLVEARKKSIANNILPQGVETPNHEAYLVFNLEKIEVGFVWIELRGDNKDRAFGYDIQIYEEYRNQGYGKEVFIQAKKFLKERGVRNLSVHVFSHNHIAYNLYKKVGFKEVSVNMNLEIE